MNEIMFGTYAETNEALRHAAFLAESIRLFGGKYKDSPIKIYSPDSFSEKDVGITTLLGSLLVELEISNPPVESENFSYRGKTFAAGKAEKDAERQAQFLVWMDEDTIVLQEPAEFCLKDGILMGYRPVTHNRSGNLFGQGPGPWWSRIYKLLEIDEITLFAMVTPADSQLIRAYFNAGLIVVRPECGILNSWGGCFRILYTDSTLAAMCAQNATYNIFLHQAALVGAVFNSLTQDEMVCLSDRYNYPMFFKRMFGAQKEFDDLSGIVTLRYDAYFQNPDPDWPQLLRGPGDRIEWLKTKLGN